MNTIPFGVVREASSRGGAAHLDVEAGGIEGIESMGKNEEEEEGQEKEQDPRQVEQPSVDLADYPVNSKLKAFIYVHAGWRRHKDGRSALCPHCQEVVRCAGNTTNLENHMRRNHKIQYRLQEAEKAARAKEQGYPTFQSM